MLVRFWGTRGSIPAPLSGTAVRQKVRTALTRSIGRGLASEADVDRFLDEELAFEVASSYGGNTSCVEIVTGGDEYYVCDLGTGARNFGNAALGRHGPGKPQTYNVFMSHVHWDHIMGFPFFVPAYIPGNRVVIHGCHDVLEAAFRRQHGGPSFPVKFEQLGASIEFRTLEVGQTTQVGDLSVRTLAQHHEGDSYGYRFEKDGKSIVYSTDSEHKFDSIDDRYPFVEFFRGADLVVFDAMYSLADSISVKEDWGHSSNIVGVELCHMAGAKHLCLFHHEPNYDDATISQLLRETIRFEEISEEGRMLRVSSAYDGLEIEV